MKKIRMLMALLVCGVLITTITGCDKESEGDPIAEAFWEGAMRGFTDIEVTVDPGVGQIIAAADVAGGGDIQVYIDSLKTGTYNFGQKTNVYLNWNGNYYYSSAAGASGTVMLNKLDMDKKWMELTFSGTLVAPGNNNATLDVTQGTIHSSFTSR